MDTVDYVKPADVAAAMVETGKRKLALAPRDLLIRDMLSGAILGVATSLAFTGVVQSNLPLGGALIFPVGLISIVLLGLELVTGSFALVPLPWLSRETSATAVLVNWGWVFIGNLIGSVAYGALIAIALTNMGTAPPAGVAARIVQVAEAVTVADWWLWNQIPVTLGNLVGGFIFTGFAIYATYKPRILAPRSWRRRRPASPPNRVPARAAKAADRSR
jgi:formate/nitrite transporter FocA (FNT family)